MNYSKAKLQKVVAKADDPEIIATSERVVKAIKKHFPHGLIECSPREGLGLHLNLFFGLTPDKKYWPNGYSDNLPVRLKTVIHISSNSEGYLYEIHKGSKIRISINPEEGSYNAMGTVKVRAMQSKEMTADKLVTAIDKHFAMAKKLVKEHDANIYRRSNYPDKYFA